MTSTFGIPIFKTVEPETKKKARHHVSCGKLGKILSS